MHISGILTQAYLFLSSAACAIKQNICIMNTRQRTKTEGAEGVESGDVAMCPLPGKFWLLIINLLSSWRRERTAALHRSPQNNAFGAIVVQFWCILSYIRLLALKQSKISWAIGPPLNTSMLASRYTDWVCLVYIPTSSCRSISHECKMNLVMGDCQRPKNGKYRTNLHLTTQSAVLAMIDSVRLSVCHNPVLCQNDSSYDHAVFTGG